MREDRSVGPRDFYLGSSPSGDMEKGQAPLDPVDEEEVTRPEAQGRAFQQETPPVTVGDGARACDTPGVGCWPRDARGFRGGGGPPSDAPRASRRKGNGLLSVPPKGKYCCCPTSDTSERQVLPR